MAEENDTPGAAEAEPTNEELLQIINGGQAPAPKQKAKARAGADEAEDDDIEADEDLGGDDDDGEPKSKAKAKGDDAGDEDLDADQADEGDDEKDDDATGDEDPDAKLDDDDKKVRAKFTPEQQSMFDKAVSKKTRRILELKTELREEQTARETAEARAIELDKSSSTASAVATADNPLGDLDDETKLDAKLTDARKLRRFALANPDGAFVDQKTGEVVEVEDPQNPPEGVVAFSKRRIGQILAETEEMLQEHGPKHRKFLQDRAAADAAAVREIPWLKNKNSQGYVAVEATLRHAPQLRSVPGIKLLLADAFIGRAIRVNSKQQQAKSGPGKPGDGKDRKAPPSPGGSARPPKVDAKSKLVGGAMKTLAETGDDSGNAALRAILKS